MRILISAFFLLIPAWADTTIQVAGVTARQATLRVKTDQTGNCTYKISESVNLAPLVNDVNPILFAGADSDQRPGAIVSGNDHYFVAGTTAPGTLSAGLVIKSRALAANTHHWGQVTCGIDTVSFEFTTDNPAYSNFYPEPAPFNANGYGNYGWPTQDWTTLNPATVVDPTSGFKVKRITSPGWWGIERGAATASTVIDPTNSWANAGNANSGSINSLATFNGAVDPTKYLFLPFDILDAPGGSGGGAGWGSNWTADDLQLRMFGRANSGSGVVSACLVYYDSQTCNSGTLTATLPTSNGTSLITPAGYPRFPFAGWGGTPPTRTAIGTHSGPVSVAGMVVIFNASSSQQYANPRWLPGALIRINAATGCTAGTYTIASVDSATQVTLTNPAGTCNSSFQSMAAGIKIWKGGGTGTISVSTNFNIAWSAIFRSYASGGRDICSQVPLVDSAYTGRPIYLCAVPAADNAASSHYVAFGFIPSTGEVRFLGPLFAQPNSSDAPNDRFVGALSYVQSGFDSSDGRVFYAVAATGPGGQYSSAVKVRYTEDFTAWSHPLYTDINHNPGEDPANSGHPYADAGFTFTNIMKASQGKDFITQIAALNPQYDATIFANPAVAGGYAGKLYWNMGTGTGETIGLTAITDSTGTMVQTGDIWSGSFPGRWGSNHATEVIPGYLGIVLNTLGLGGDFTPRPTVVAGGPFQATPTCVYKSGVCNPDISLTATAPLDSCVGLVPAFLVAQFSNPTILDPAANRCIRFRTRNFASHTPTAAEKRKWPSAQNSAWSEIATIQVGDQFITTSMPITAATNAASAVFTSVGHNIPFGNSAPIYYYFSGATGSWAGLNGGRFVTVIDADHFSTNFDSTNAGAVSGSILLSPCENMMVLSVDEIGGNPKLYEVVAYRGFGVLASFSNSAPPKSAGASWAAVATPPNVAGCVAFFCTPGIGLWMDASALGTPAKYLLDPGAFSGHADLGAGPTSGASTYVRAGQPGAPYAVRYNKPFLVQVGDNFADANTITVPTSFNGVQTGILNQQSYPSLRQVTPESDKSWFVDMHASNASNGSGYEVGSLMCQPAYSLVAGTMGVFDFSSPCGTVNVKHLPLAVIGGTYQLQDVSSPATGDIITDATPWKFCTPLRADECRTGSVIGHVYASIPQASTNPYCISAQSSVFFPCAFVPDPTLGKIIQVRASASDPGAQFWRAAGMGFGGIGRHDQFSVATTDPTGTWAFSGNVWLDGRRYDRIATQLPSTAPITGAARTGYANYSVHLGSESAYAEIQFGYAENGSTENYYCTSRAESCNTSGSPFSFESETRTLTRCTGGCRIRIPALPGRVVYYRIGRSADGTTWTYGPPQPPVAIP